MLKCGYGKSEENTKYPTKNEIVNDPKLEIDRIFNILFYNQNKKITEEEFNNFLECMNDYENQLYFLIKISQARTITKEIPEEVLQYLERIFSFILDLFNIHNISNKEFGILSLIISLSKTFYYVKGIITKKRIYPYEKLTSKEIFQKKGFWKEFLEYLINEERKKKIEELNNKLTKKQIKYLEADIAFTPMLVIILYMKNFGFKENEIEILINDSFKKYNISEELKDTVNLYIKANK